MTHKKWRKTRGELTFTEGQLALKVLTSITKKVTTLGFGLGIPKAQSNNRKDCQQRQRLLQFLGLVVDSCLPQSFPSSATTRLLFSPPPSRRLRGPL